MIASRSTPDRSRTAPPRLRRLGLGLCALGSCLLGGCAQPPASGSLQPGGSGPQGSVESPPLQSGRVDEAALQPPRPLRIASWNLEWLHRNEGAGPVPRRAEDYARLRDYAERLGADIVAVQEVDGAEALQRVFDPSRYELQLAEERGSQLGGFAARRGLELTRHPDVTALNTTGGLRNGVDISVRTDRASLRLLGVHLKSGCFDAPLHSTQSSCRKLRQQLPRLEQWIDARAAEEQPFLVIGDFNRQLQQGDAFYSELDDGEPANADLTLVTDGHKSRCWGGEYPNFIDHIAVSRDAARWIVAGSFAQQLYDEADAPNRRRLSDHCPISILLTPGASSASSAPTPAPSPPRPSASAPEQPPGAPAAGRSIKGNVSSRGRKLYHVPGCPQYEHVRIDASKGERLFSTEAQALAAGWVKAPGCP